VSAFGGQKPQFLANFDIFGGSCTDTLLMTRAKFGVLEQTHGVRLPANFRLDRFILSPSGGEKPQFLPFFWTSVYLVVSLFGSSLRKLKMGAQLQTFPYPKASKSFLYPNAFMAKSSKQTLKFKSVTDRQTNRQTKNSTFLAAPAAGEIRAPPNSAWR